MTDLDWISFRAAQNFPLQDQATGLSTNSTLLPKSLLLDLKINIPPGTQENLVDNFYISRIVDTGNTLSIYIGCMEGGQGSQCALCSGIPKTLGMSQSIAQRYFTLSPISGSFDWAPKMTGSLCVGSTQTYNSGLLRFSYATAKINSMCISLFSLTALQAIRVRDQVFTGIVDIKQGQGVIINTGTGQDQFTGQSFTSIYVYLDQAYIQQKLDKAVAQYIQITRPKQTSDSASQSASTSPQQPQQPEQPEQPQEEKLYVRSINGVFPDATGNIQIKGMDCVLVSGVSSHGVISIKNTCAKPCCDSTNISAMSADIAKIQAQQDILRTYFTNQANLINYMQANLSTLMTQR